MVEILFRERIVVNEAYVNEFNNIDSVSNLNQQQQQQQSANNRKTSRVSEFLGTANKHNNSSLVNQTPILANISLSNPFYENSFPVSF